MLPGTSSTFFLIFGLCERDLGNVQTEDTGYAKTLGN